MQKPSDVLSIGQEIEAKVVDFNERDKKISLSIKAMEAAAHTAPAEDADVADVERGELLQRKQKRNKDQSPFMYERKETLYGRKSRMQCLFLRLGNGVSHQRTEKPFSETAGICPASVRLIWI